MCDIEYLYAMVKRDSDSKAIYGYLIEFLRKNMMKPSLPPLKGDGLTPPPFEKPSIAQVLANCVHIVDYQFTEEGSG